MDFLTSKLQYTIQFQFSLFIVQALSYPVENIFFPCSLYVCTTCTMCTLFPGTHLYKWINPRLNIVFRQQLNSISKSISAAISSVQQNLQAKGTWSKKSKQLAAWANADMSSKAKSGSAVPIWASCLFGDLEGVRRALANGQDVNVRSPLGVPGLMYACSGSHNGILDLLLVVDFKCWYSC